jgi:hypothetical protein
LVLSAAALASIHHEHARRELALRTRVVVGLIDSEATERDIDVRQIAALEVMRLVIEGQDGPTFTEALNVSTGETVGHALISLQW